MMTNISCDSAEVIWDNSNDVIYYEGKLYFPSDSTNAQNSTLNNNNVGNNANSNSDNINNGAKNKLPENSAVGHATHGEEVVSGAQFWFFVFMILRKFFFNFIYLFFNLCLLF